MASFDRIASTARDSLSNLSGSRRARRWGIGIAVFLVIFGLLGFFVAPPLLHDQAEKQLSVLLDRPVSIGKISLNPFTLSLAVNQLRIGERGDAGDFVTLDELVVRASWFSALRLKPIVREVFLARLNVKIVRSGPQAFNFSDIVEKFAKPADEPEKPGKPLLFVVSNIHMDEGRVEFDDQPVKQHHLIEHINLGVPFIANLPSKVEIFSQPLLQAVIDGSPLLIEGKTRPFDGKFTSDVRVKLDELNLPELMPYAPATLPVLLPRGKLSTDLNVRFAMDGDRASVELAGSADLKDLALTDRARAPLLSVGALHVAAESVEPLLNVAHLSEVRIDKPAVSLVRDAQGALVLPHAAPAKAAPEAPAKKDKAAAPFDLALKKFALNDGAVRLDDRQAGAKLGLSKIALTLSDISTIEKKAGRYTARLSLDSGGTLSSNGALNLAQGKADANAQLEQLALTALQPYLGNTLPGRVTGGSAGAKLALKADWSGEQPQVQLGASEAHVDGLRLQRGKQNRTLLALNHAGVDLQQFDLASRNAKVGAVTVRGLQLNVYRAPDGSINLLKPEGQGAKPAPAAAPAKAAGPAQAWTYSVGMIDLDESGVVFTDRSNKTPVSLKLTPLKIKVQNISNDLAKPAQLDASIGFGEKGKITLGGAVTPQPLSMKLQLDGDHLDIAALAPYFASHINASLASALLSIKGGIKLASDDKDGLKVYYRGDAGLHKLRMLDGVTSDLFASWRSLDLNDIHAAYDPRGTRLQVGKITLDDFYSRILLYANGRLNLDNFMATQDTHDRSLTRVDDTAPAAAVPAAQAAAEKPSKPLKLGFGRILLHRGKVDYSDHFIKPNFSANLVDIEGDIGAFGTDSTEPATVAVQASLNGNGPVTINGKINPLAKPPSLDMTAGAHDIDLTNFTSYAVKYAGYPIVKGKLNVDLHYVLDQNKLDADNHLFIDQFTFGDHVDSPTATNLPVRLAISLLKNSRGEIDADIPVSGSLDDPQFSIGSLLWHAVANLIERAATSPFSLLAGAFSGGDGEDLGYIAFEPGLAVLSDAEAQKLEALSKALADKPGVKLDITGRVDPALDTPGLKQAKVERQIKRQKIKDTVGKGASVDPDEITIEPGEYDKYLEMAYKAAEMKKPRNFIGLAKSQPPEKMKQLLLDNVNVGDAELTALAQKRATAVQQKLSATVEASRLFPVAPKLDAEGIEDKGPTTRVEFNLE